MFALSFNTSVYALEEKILSIGNVTLSSSSGGRFSSDFAIGSPSYISNLDLSGFTSTNINQALNLIFLEDVGGVIHSRFTAKVTFTNGVASYTVDSVYGDISTIKVTHYRLGINQLSPSYTVTFGGQIKLNGNFGTTPPVEEFKLISKNADTENNTYKFLFNKDFTVNLSDIEFTDSNGNSIEFIHSINNKELTITPTSSLQEGVYKINLKKVTSNNDEELTATLNFIVKSNFYVVYKDFYSFLTLDLEDINIEFNKSFSVTHLSLDSVSLQGTIQDNVLKISLPTLTADTDYNLNLTVRSVDNEELVLTFPLTTRSLTGNPFLDRILGPILNMLENAKKNGVVIVITAISTGIVFVVAMWLWKKAKQWLKKI